MKSTFLDRLKAMAFEEVNTTLRAEAEARGRAEGRLESSRACCAPGWGAARRAG